MNEQNLGNANTNTSSNVFDPLTGLKKYEYFVSDLKGLFLKTKILPISSWLLSIQTFVISNISTTPLAIIVEMSY